MDSPQPVWIMDCFPTVVYLFLKNTFFIMYLYIFGPFRWMRISAYTGAAITTAFYVATTVAALIFSTPRGGETWAEHSLSSYQKRALALPVPTSSFGVVVDVYILILPIVAVLQLQLPTERKVGVICVFMTGSL